MLLHLVVLLQILQLCDLDFVASGDSGGSHVCLKNLEW